MIARFVDYVYSETSLPSMGVRTEFVTNVDTWEVHKIGLGKRVTVAAEEASDPKIRRGMSMSKIQMKPAKFVVPIEVSEDFFQYNLDQDGMRRRAIKLFTTAMANDLESFIYESNTLGHAILESELDPDGGAPNKYVLDVAQSKFDGLLRQAESGNVVDAQNAQIGAPVTDVAIRAMPTKFRKNRKLLSALYSADLDQMYRFKLSGRGTGFGDVALQGEMPITIFGLKHFGASLFPHLPKVTRHVTLTGTSEVSLGFTNISSVVVTPSTLGKAPTSAYVESTDGSNNDYVVDYVAGKIRRTATSSITTGSTVKVTFLSSPQMIVTMPQNIVVGVGADLKIKYDEDIYKDTWQAAIHYKGAVTFEEVSAVVLCKNISTSV
jgi:hypothetical protein